MQIDEQERVFRCPEKAVGGRGARGAAELFEPA